MKQLFYTSLICLLPLFLSGCIENALLVDLNPDGSGTLTVRLLSRTEPAQGVVEQAHSMKDILSDASQFGDGIELVEIKDISNPAGWKGAMATYRFENIETVHLQQTRVQPDQDSAQTSGMPVNHDMRYRFEFSPGPEATLSVHPEFVNTEDIKEKPVEVGSDEDPFAAAGLDESDPIPGLAGGMEQMGNSLMTAMLSSVAPLLKGMRISYLIRINGEIGDTNAKHRPKDNSILVMDMKVDQLLSDPELVEKLTGSLESWSELSNMDLPALKMQDPAEPLTVSFK